MKHLPVRWIAGVALASLAACAGPQSALGTASSPVNRRLTTRDTDILFVSGSCVVKPFSGMCMFAFPSGEYLSWIEYHSPSGIFGMCPGRNGHVFITGGGYDGFVIVEYQHDGNGPIRSFDDGGLYQPEGCAVDDAVQHLAVANTAASGTNGNVSVFVPGPQYPTIYTSSRLYSPAYCAYDDRGNLFVDGTDASGNFQLAELTKGASSLHPLSADKRIVSAGPIQWVGRHLAVGYGDLNGSVIFQVRVAGSKAGIAGTTRLKQRLRLRTQFGPFWIQNGRVVASFNDEGSYPIGIWNYPAGGYATHLIRRGTNSGRQRVMTVSQPPKS